MATASWRSLEKPLNDGILAVIENEFKFDKMTPVQVRARFIHSYLAIELE